MTEPWMEQVIEKLYRIKKGTFVDVGVNIGQTLIKLKLIDRGADYIGFEPNPSCVFYSNELIKVNNLKNTLIVPVAISEESSLVTLFFYSNTIMDSSASIIKDFRPQKIFKTEYVPAFNYFSIQSVFNDKTISIIKIDVEGAELSVLRSMNDLIHRDRPFVLVEVLPVYSNDNIDRVDRQNGIERLIQEWDYKLFRISKNLNETLKGFEPLGEFGLTTDVSQSDYLICPMELLAKLEQ